MDRGADQFIVARTKSSASEWKVGAFLRTSRATDAFYDRQLGLHVICDEAECTQAKASPQACAFQ